MNIVKQAKNLGFIASGLSPSEKPPFFDAFCKWIDAENFGQMAWLQKHRSLREDPGKLLRECRAIISLAYPYSSAKPCTPDGYTMARYSAPKNNDYHIRLRKKAERLATEIKASYPGAKTRVCVDSAPILERSFAHRSGMGFLGKNNMFIVPGHGSYLFLAEILTTAELPPFLDRTTTEDLCRDCTRCVDACPTGALESPRHLNASKCLSYLTIEYGGDLDQETGKRMGRCFLGCDMCQEVCPFNGLKKTDEISLPGITEFLKMEEREFKTLFGQTALARPGLGRIQRNIKAILH
ncbi:MAG: tRNA epoxyqueuosine(34) reductase QueG [Deltaproteobacteria bacterium]|jgi:epoxyqueuosine reductase|nr:tRNA epoxyqueuosine(34) reductase QueG [Deltaproteobacteria bacterium]